MTNPDGRVAAGDQCLEICPRTFVYVCVSVYLYVCNTHNAVHLFPSLSFSGGLFEFSGSCVVSCPENHMVDNNVCTPCVAPCPQGTECHGWSGADAVQNDVIMEEFLNNECAIVNGHIRFNLITAECRNQDPAQFCDPS